MHAEGHGALFVVSPRFLPTAGRRAVRRETWRELPSLQHGRRAYPSGFETLGLRREYRPRVNAQAATHERRQGLGLIGADQILASQGGEPSTRLRRTHRAIARTNLLSQEIPAAS